MSSLTEFFESEFNTQREQWENSLKAELKLTEVGTKGHKKLLSGQMWPTLSLKSRSSHIPCSEKWKKASVTYVSLKSIEISSRLTEDLDNGVRIFFFHREALDSKKWSEIDQALGNFDKRNELDVFIIGEDTKKQNQKNEDYRSSKFQVISSIISGKTIHDDGGHSVQELGLMAYELVQKLSSLELNNSNSGNFYLGVYLDSQFFYNIAKIRAAKLLALKVVQETGKDVAFRVVALTSYREWTLFERYSNMLRNESAVASAYIAGADHVQSSGYNSLFELETDETDPDHTERSHRMARNTGHVLALESMLGVVEDAAFGSYHLENLTHALAEDSWKFMQRLFSIEQTDLKNILSEEASDIRKKRLTNIKTRKKIISGINDFPDVKEVLNIRLKEELFFREARIFEELRLKVTSLSLRPSVYIALCGNYESSRVSFVKNYFELLGLNVIDPAHSQVDLDKLKEELKKQNDNIVVLCAAETDKEILEDLSQEVHSKYRYIAGKNPISGFTNITAGQNIYDVLQDLVQKITGSNS